ncbi:MAG: hypothetical protein CMK74_20230 [Pseudomonadales bacterium]|nr:hypothetical protein [Pseudomonadales bacterium]
MSTEENTPQPAAPVAITVTLAAISAIPAIKPLSGMLAGRWAAIEQLISTNPVFEKRLAKVYGEATTGDSDAIEHLTALACLGGEYVMKNVSAFKAKVPKAARVLDWHAAMSKELSNVLSAAAYGSIVDISRETSSGGIKSSGAPKALRALVEKHDAIEGTTDEAVAARQSVTLEVMAFYAMSRGTQNTLYQSNNEPSFDATNPETGEPVVTDKDGNVKRVSLSWGHRNDAYRRSTKKKKTPATPAATADTAAAPAAAAADPEATSAKTPTPAASTAA